MTKKYFFLSFLYVVLLPVLLRSQDTATYIDASGNVLYFLHGNPCTESAAAQQCYLVRPRGGYTVEPSGSVIIPSSVSFYCEDDSSWHPMKVTEISGVDWHGPIDAPYASPGVFENCTEITSVSIPSTISRIGSRAFAGCTGLASLPDLSHVSYISDSAFAGCTGFTVENLLLDSVYSYNMYHYAYPDYQPLWEKREVGYGHHAFAGCTGIDTLTILSGGFSDAVFANCTGINSLNLLGYIGVYFSAVPYYPKYLFSGCTGLTSVNYPRGYIWSAMFSFCTNLTTVTIGPDVVGIEPFAFYGCTNLSTVNFNADSCLNMCYVSYSGNFQQWGPFSYLPSFNTLNIGENVKIIPAGAFQKCTGLTQVHIPASVTNFGSHWSYNAYHSGFHNPFDSCVNLTTITVDENNTVYDSRNNCNAVIETATNTLLSGYYATIPATVTSIGRTAYRNFTSLEAIEIPESVTQIGMDAFYNCSNLRRLTIGSNVDTINAGAFAFCSNLDTIYSLSATPPALSIYGSYFPFYRIPDSAVAIVPCNAVDAYSNDYLWNFSIPNFQCDSSISYAENYQLTVISSDTLMGTVTGGGVYADGATATLTAIPAPCHQFSGWGDGVADNPRSLTVNADTTITAIFAPIAAATGDVAATACDSYTWNGQTYTASGTYTFATSTVAGCDSIATLSLTLNYSVADTLEATATESYDWNGQTYTESGAYTYSGTTVHGCDSTVTLLLTIEPPVVYYTVTVASSDDAMGSVLGGGTYEAGTEVTLTATPAEGHEFVQWSDGLADNPRTLVLTSDTTFVAQFQPEVGIQHPTSDLRLTIHPNPARSTVTLSGLEPGAKVTIVDLNGREVLSLTTDDSTLTTDVSSLTSGAYFVRVTGERQTAVRKLIVK